MIARRMPLHFAAALLITASLAGCSDEQAAAPRPAPAKVQVSAQTLRPQTVTLTAQLPGRTSAHMVSEVRPRVGGIVRTRNFDEGSDVKAGDILYELDPAPFEAAFRNAEAALQRANGAIPSATARLERYMNLTTRNGRQPTGPGRGADHHAAGASRRCRSRCARWRQHGSIWNIPRSARRSTAASTRRASRRARSSLQIRRRHSQRSGSLPRSMSMSFNPASIC